MGKSVEVSNRRLMTFQCREGKIKETGKVALRRRFGGGGGGGSGAAFML
jgi:hypothetical protein